MRYFRVTKFAQYQHYKHRKPPWCKLYRRLIDPQHCADFMALPDATKAHAMLLLLLATDCDNCMPYDARIVGGKIGATEPVDLDTLQGMEYIELLPEGANTCPDGASNSLCSSDPKNRVTEGLYFESCQHRSGKNSSETAKQCAHAVQAAFTQGDAEHAMQCFESVQGDMQARVLSMLATWFDDVSNGHLLAAMHAVGDPGFVLSHVPLYLAAVQDDAERRSGKPY